MNLENLTDAFTDYLPYSDQSVEYPKLDLVSPNNGVEPEWFYPAVMNNNHSEPVAIHKYIAQKTMFSEYSEMMLGIAMIEMRHYGILLELIEQLGGKIQAKIDLESSKVSKTIKEALEDDIKSEKATIEFYESIVDKIPKFMNVTQQTVLELMIKLIADEEKHLQLLTAELEKLKDE